MNMPVSSRPVAVDRPDALTVRPDPAAVAVPGVLTAVWKGFASFDLVGRQPGAGDGIVSTADLRELVRTRPGSEEARIADIVLKQPGRYPVFQGAGATAEAVLGQIAGLAKAAFSVLDGNGDGSLRWQEPPRASGALGQSEVPRALWTALAGNRKLFDALAGSNGTITLASLDGVIAKANAGPPATPQPALIVQAWTAFRALAAGTGRPDGVLTVADLRAVAGSATAPADLKRLAMALLAAPAWLKSTAGADGKISLGEMSRAVALVVRSNFGRLDVVPADGGIAAADLKALTNRESAAYKAATPATRALAAALKSAGPLLKLLSGGQPAITAASLDALIAPRPSARSPQAVARDALLQFGRLDVSGNRSISVAELDYVLKELTPSPTLKKLATEMKSMFAVLSGGDAAITQADLVKVAGLLPR